MGTAALQQVEKEEAQKIKCIVWDLDNTVWDGTLLEDKQVSLREGVEDTIKTLDNRGILQSISSKNEENMAMEKLQELGLSDYFIYPQINWNPKSVSVKKIAESINIGVDTLAFIDDQPYEIDEVKHSLPEVLCIDADLINKILDMPEMMPRFITYESKMRRAMYQSDIRRNSIESDFQGPTEDFLESLNMKFTISKASEEDLKRAEELTVRTHQLNTTGYTYSYDELDHYRKSDQYELLVASLEDKYGPYGKIGLSLIELGEDIWTIKLLLMSCRVMSRGVGSIMINHIRKMAKQNNVRLQAEWVQSDVNRMMYMTYKFMHFQEAGKKGDLTILENDLSEIQENPGYVDIIIQ